MNSCIYETPLNVVLGYIWTERGLREMSFYSDEECFRDYLESLSLELNNERLIDLEEMLDSYFSGEPTQLDYPLDISGTDFQRRVWEAVRQIPYGQVRSYKWVASKIGNPKAARAVGTAISRNPVVLIIPCHRVIRSNGSLGKYSDMDWLKERLLRLERAEIVSWKI
jgi:O-6-methylguanine DNA methyltransferase